MNRKFLIFTVVALLIALSMAACGKKPAEGKKPGNTQPETQVSTDPTDPGDPDATEGAEGTTEPTLNAGTEVGSGREEITGGTQPESTTPTAPSDKPTTPVPAPDDGLSMNYLQYMALSNQEQQAFFDKYFSDDPLGFATWFQKVKQAYDDETPEIIATGPIDIGDYIDP